jgi:spore maturation protein CgeB
MLGACYLTEHTSGVEQLYDVGNEIETYRSADELVAKLGELEKDKARRTRLRIAGQRKALQEHSVARSLLRISTLLNIV